MKYVIITQDGIGRIVFGRTPEDVSSLYTDSLETCIAVLVVGTRGVTLMHVTQKFYVAAVAEEFTKVGEVKNWVIVHNKDRKFAFKVVTNLSRFESLKEKYRSTLAEDCGCATGSVAITRGGEVLLDPVDIDAACLLSPPDLDRRHRVNILNNFFLSEAESMWPDVQYDEDHFGELPGLRKTPKEMLSFFDEKLKEVTSDLFGELDWGEFVARRQHLERGLGNLLAYLLAYEPELYQEIAQSCVVNKRLTESQLQEAELYVLHEILLKERIYEKSEIAVAFRKAAGYGHREHLRIMFAESSKILDSPGATSGKTALHVAVAKGRLENVEFLLAVGADSSIQDSEHKTAKDYAETDEMQTLFVSVTPSP